MAIKMSDTDLAHLLSWLELHLPQSFMVHGQVKSHLRGQFPDVDFFVDGWPHPQAVVARTLPSLEQPMNKEAQMGTVIEGMFCLNGTALNSMLRDPVVVAWHKRVTLCGVPARQMSEVLALTKEMEKSVSLDSCIMMKATPQDLKPIPIPEGVKAQPISNAEVRMIHSTWKFASERSEAYIQQSVQRFPSMYLVTENGHYVGHMIGTNDGTMKMLFVNPEFRGKGHAKVIVSQLAQKYFDMGEDAYIFADEDNVASQKLHQALGFKEVAEMNLVWVVCD